MFYLYLIQNKITDAVYVGQSVNPQGRIRVHRFALNAGKHKNPYLQKAWLKYGAQAFEDFVLGNYETREQSNEAEKFYIAWYKALKLSYNNLDGGDGCCNPDAETRAKMRAAKLGKPQSEEHKAKYKGRPSPRKGVPVSEETRAKQRAAKVGKKLTEEHKSKLAAALAKREFTPEYRKKLSEANKGNQNSKGRKVVISDEQKEKIRQSLLEYNRKKRAL